MDTHGTHGYQTLADYVSIEGQLKLSLPVTCLRNRDEVVRWDGLFKRLV